MPPDKDIRLGPRLEDVKYENKLTGIDYLTGIELPLDRLVIVTADKPEFGIEEARYITRFTYEYGVGTAKKPPCVVSKSALATVRKAMNEDVPVEITDYKNED